VGYESKQFGDDALLQQHDPVHVVVKAAKADGEHDEEDHEEASTAVKDSTKPTVAGVTGIATVEELDRQRGCRQLFRSMMFGADIEVFVLDLRAGSLDESNKTQQLCYLGKDQAAWLQHSIINSNAMWKIVLCGQTFGLIRRDTTLETPADDSSSSSSVILVAPGEGNWADESMAPRSDDSQSSVPAPLKRKTSVSLVAGPQHGQPVPPRSPKNSAKRSATPPPSMRAVSAGGGDMVRSQTPTSALMSATAPPLKSSLRSDSSMALVGSDEFKASNDALSREGAAADMGGGDDSAYPSVKPTSSAGGRKVVSVHMAAEVEELEREVEVVEEFSAPHSLLSVLAACEAAHTEKMQRIAVSEMRRGYSSAGSLSGGGANGDADNVSVASNSSTLLDGVGSSVLGSSPSANSFDMNPSQVLAEPLPTYTADGVKIARLSSGVVLLSGGTPVGSDLVTGSAIPSFVSVYRSLTFPSQSDAAASGGSNFHTMASAAEQPLGTAEAFCAEIGLGSALYSLDEARACESQYAYVSGLSGVTLLDNLAVNESGSAPAATIMGTSTCGLHLNADGSLRVQVNFFPMYSSIVDVATHQQETERHAVPLFACEFRAPPPLTDVAAGSSADDAK
jgi:hypothetical protein